MTKTKKIDNKEFIIFTDGGARGNPGPAGIGVAIYDVENNLLKTHKEYIGETTNNVAEYKGALKAVELALEMGAEILHMNLDSELVVKQLNREYKVKNEDLGKIFIQIHNLIQSLKKVDFTHVRREQNKLADSLVNQALDEYV